MGLFDKLSNLIFEEDSGTNKPNDSGEKKKRFSDFFFTDADDNSKDVKKKKKFSDIFFEDASKPGESSFVDEEKETVLDDLPSKIQYRESELIKVGEVLKTVDPNEYPDSGPEIKSYLSMIERISKIKQILESKDDVFSTVRNYELESEYKRLELEYQNNINAIKTLCYVSEIKTVNEQLVELFSKRFTNRTDAEIRNLENYITLISKKGELFDKKYEDRVYKGLIEAEYRINLLKLMNDIYKGQAPRKNPFSKFSEQKRKIFETYLSRDVQDTSGKYNEISSAEERYTKTFLVQSVIFRKIDQMASQIADRINKYSIDNFLINELLDNGEGYETLKMFLSFRLKLNDIDSKTQEANERYLDQFYKKTTSNNGSNNGKKSPTGNSSNDRFPWDE